MRAKRWTVVALAAATVAGATVVALGGSAPAGAADGPFAPLDRPGPALSVPVATLDAALHCVGDLSHATVEPVLLNPATGVTPEQNYSWNYENAFTAQHRPWCAVTMPYHTEGDIQVAGEYLVHAIRTMYATAHRRIAVVGHSQGGMSMRWALRFWPDTRAMVDDVVGMAGSNHGTSGLNCVAGYTRCPAASWQQGAKADFIQALNSGTETFAGISYTEIFTHTDEVVTPNFTDKMAVSALHTGAGRITNVATQDICPLDVYEHLSIGTVDPVAYALVMDALTHDGPAQPARVNRAVCLQLYQPGVNPLSANTELQILSAIPGLAAVDTPGFNVLGIPELPAEPALKCYVFAAGC